MPFLDAPPFCKPCEQITPGERRCDFLTAGKALSSKQFDACVEDLLRLRYGDNARFMAQAIERNLDRG